MSIGAVLLFSGCWDEEGGIPSPTPTPTPSPIPFPTPTPSPVASAIEAEALSDLASEVSADNASLIQAASEDAVRQMAVVSDAVSKEPLTKENIAKARLALANAREAFLLAEASLYFTDPENPDEQAALPSKLASELPDLSIPGFDELDLLLASANEETPPADIVSQAQSLQTDLEQIANAWNPNSLNNFRNAVFLKDTDSAGRIFQGVLAATDLAALSELNVNSQSQTLSRLWVLKDLYEGTYESFSGNAISGKSLRDLIEKTDPKTALKIRELLDVLIVQQGGPISMGQYSVSPSFETLRGEFLATARSLGYDLTLSQDALPEEAN